jgi:glycosyltransferase involved in cell wall biosynthesis
MENKDSSPTISVVMATFNDGLYISEAIDSILSQSFTDFEFIIINDGSSDNTLEIINQFAIIDPRIRVISRENQGLAISLNEGIAYASGQWIARMDADDISHPLRFERQLAWLDTHDADVCGTWIQLFGQRNQLKKYHQEDYLIKKELLFGSPIGHATVLMRRSKARQLQYDAQFDRAEDYDFFEKAAIAGWKFTNIPDLLYFYRFHPKQTSTVLYQEQQRVSQQVRRRYWSSISAVYGLNDGDIEAVINTRSLGEIVSGHSNKLNFVFNKLLSKSDREERDVIFGGLMPLYLRIAGSDKDAYQNLKKLSKKYSHPIAAGLRLQMILLSLFRIKANSRLYCYLENFYLKFFG